MAWLGEIVCYYCTVDLLWIQAIREHDGELPHLYQTHGDHDTLVQSQWGGTTHKKLRQLGVTGLYKVYPSMGHELSESVIDGLKHWILTKLPADGEA